MNAPIPFTYGEHPVRVVNIDGEPWFVATDVAAILELANVRSSLALLDADERGVQTVDTPGGAQQMNCINEPGLYSLILRSRKPEARDFKRWVTHEVLPSIRKHGGYLTEDKIEEVLTNPDTIIELAQELKRARKAREAMESYARELEPKADAYTRFMDGDGSYSIGSVAKMLGLSQNKLFDRLRGAGILIAKGHMRNTPYQKYMHHFVVKASEYERSDGTRGTSYTTRILPSGVEFIARKLGLEIREEAAA